MILGWSSIAERRVLPALAHLGATRVDVASRTRVVTLPDGMQGQAYRDYDEALLRSDAEWVYVSTRNHEHASWAARALEAGRHVIVDKPAATALTDVEHLVTFAAQHGRFIAEATVYVWHPQVERLRQLAQDAGPVTKVAATFRYPPLPAENFRMRAAQGGGALWDLGPYAVSACRLFFGDSPEEIIVHAARRDGDEVETSFNVLMRFPDGRRFVGQFGMTTTYVNRLVISGPHLEATLNRVFTSDPDKAGVISAEQGNGHVTIEVPAADAFERFFADAFAAAADGRHVPFGELMLDDARRMKELVHAAR